MINIQLERLPGQMLRLVVLLCLACTIVGCAGTAPTLPSSPDAAATTPVEPGWYAIDQLVRSDQLDGIDLHLRAAERTADGLTLHLSFYNNGDVDFSVVRGIDLSQARLAGARAYAPSARSASFESGIAPPQRWVSGGASTGTLTFAGAEGASFELRVPGFPALPFILDQTDASPVPVAVPNGAYQYDVEVLSTQFENIALRIEEASVQADVVTLTVAFVNRNPHDIAFSSNLTGNDAVLLDHTWQQYSPTTVDAALAQDIAPPGDVWGEDEASAGTLTFPRPASGDVLLFQMPTFPLVRLPLRLNEPATVATVADLPPSSVPRADVAIAPTPTPQSGVKGARDEAARLLQRITDALERRDRDAYLAAFAPELQPERAMIFDRIGTLPLESVTWEPADTATAATLSDDGATLHNYSVEFTHQVEDVSPDNVFVSVLTATLRQQDGRWVIAALEGEQPFWTYAPTAARRSGAFWIFYRPEMEAELVTIEREAQQALDTVSEVLPQRTQATYVMYITATDEEFTDLSGRNGEQFLGVAWARFAVRQGGIEINSRAFYINGAAFQTDPAQDRQRTIAHELTHLVLSDHTMPYTPAWVSEGAAMYVTDDVPTAVLERWYREQGPDSISLETLSSQTSFGGHGSEHEQTSIAYAYSAFLAKYLIETYGDAQFWTFYDSFAEVPSDVLVEEIEASGSSFDAAVTELAPRITAEQVQASYGVDLQTLEREYETWLGEQFQR